MWMLLVGLSLVAGVVGSARTAAAVPKTCTFVTTGVTPPSTVTAVDTDNDMICEWPVGSSNLRGALTFPAGTLLEFRGNTAISADHILVANGAVLAGIASRLNDFALRATEGDVWSSGELNLRAADDVNITAAAGDVRIFGPTRLTAAGRVLVQAARHVRIAPPDKDAIDVGAFTLLGCSGVVVRARGMDGSIIINRSRIGGRSVTIDSRANLSVVGDKSLTVLGSIITTATAKTGCATGTAITISSGGPTLVSETTTLNAATRVLFATQRAGNLCLTGASTIEAGGGSGIISNAGVRGTSVLDESVNITGRLYGTYDGGTCPQPEP